MVTIPTICSPVGCVHRTPPRQIVYLSRSCRRGCEGRQAPIRLSARAETVFNAPTYSLEDVPRAKQRDLRYGMCVPPSLCASTDDTRTRELRYQAHPDPTDSISLLRRLGVGRIKSMRSYFGRKGLGMVSCHHGPYSSPILLGG